MRFFTLLFLFAFLCTSGAWAQSAPVIPNFWDPQERFIKPNVKEMPRLRFLTTTDFPPFSFIDKNKRLSGFHVDLARAICKELELLPVCQIQAFPFAELESQLLSGGGEAIIAGQTVTAASREKFAFSRPYFHLPARFVAKINSGLGEPLYLQLADKQVGVVEGSAHAAMARARFGDLQLQLFDTIETALAALEKDQVAAIFADGLQLSFWLQARLSQKPCCEFIGGPYLSQTYLGSGLSIAVEGKNRELADALNYALRTVSDRGVFAELYLRYFPISLF